MDRRPSPARQPTDLGTYRRQRRRKARRDNGKYASTVLVAAAAVGVISWEVTPAVRSVWSGVSTRESEITPDEASVYYRNCNAARAAGAAPIWRGSPGYREGLDGDGDGIACEPYYRR